MAAESPQHHLSIPLFHRKVDLPITTEQLQKLEHIILSKEGAGIAIALALGMKYVADKIALRHTRPQEPLAPVELHRAPEVPNAHTFDLLHENSYRKAVNMARYRLGHNVEAAEDIVQQAYEGLLKSWHRYGEKPFEEVEHIFFTAVLNRIKNWRRDYGRKFKHEYPVSIDGMSEAGYEVADQQNIEDDSLNEIELREDSPFNRALNQYFNSLPPHLQRIQLLKGSGLQDKEIAEIVGDTTITSIKQSLVRMRDVVRAIGQDPEAYLKTPKTFMRTRVIDRSGWKNKKGTINE